MHHLPGGRENRLTNLNHPLVKRFGTVDFRPQGLVFLVGELSKKANLPTPTSIPSANWRLLKLLFLLANDVQDSILFNLQCEFWVVRYFDLFFPISTSRPCFSTFCWEKKWRRTQKSPRFDVSEKRSLGETWWWSKVRRAPEKTLWVILCIYNLYINMVYNKYMFISYNLSFNHLGGCCYYVGK